MSPTPDAVLHSQMIVEQASAPSSLSIGVLVDGSASAKWVLAKLRVGSSIIASSWSLTVMESNNRLRVFKFVLLVKTRFFQQSTLASLQKIEYRLFEKNLDDKKEERIHEPKLFC